MPLEAIRYIGAIGTGDTRPQVFLCEERGFRDPWVLKLMGLSAAELAADWIGCVLARRVGLRCPGIDVAHVSEQALGTAPGDIRVWARPGPAFASRLVEPALAGLNDIDVVRSPATVLGALYALDVWLEVLDRRKPDGVWNLLWDPTDEDLVVLDFGKSLSPCLQFILGLSEELVEPDYPGDVLAAADVAGARAVCDTIESVTEEELRQVVASVPAPWITGAQRERVVSFLLARAGRVRGICERVLGGGPP